MLCMELLIPLTMIGCGRYFKKTAPKEINGLFGYRTTMSMKNKDTWTFAHIYIGKIWYVSGIILLLISLAAMLMLLGKLKDVVGMAGGIICLVQLLTMIGAIIPTERALRKNFDKNGNRK